MPLAILSLLLGLAGGFLVPSTVAADACEEWVAKVESVQGRVQVRRAGELQWTPVQRRDTFCPGDIIRVQERSRVAIVARNEAVYRLDANTTITLTEPEPKQTFLLNLRRGAAYFFSHVPRSLKVITPFLNAGVEGTEFLVKVEGDQTFLSVFEGRVAATNAAGSLTVASGQSAIAKAGQAPTLHVVVRPRDAVQWALHYPPIVDFRPADFPGDAAWQVMLRQSISFYQQGDLPMAFASLAEAPNNIHDPRFFTYRAALLLTVGRVDDARVDIESALKLDPRNGRAFALQSIIAVAQNRKDDALQLAQKAVELEPASSAARVALSYAQQAGFDLRGALASLEAAVQLPPDNALAWARLAELRLSVGELKKALQAAQKAVALNLHVARTQTVLGFAYLTQIKVRGAKSAFEQAIELDQAAPLPRLGLGLAQIRQGKLKEGRREIAIAASLDPNNSLIRSYLGKAYFEEKRDKLARDQFAAAKELDPQDPTPWFYDAIRKQSVNRPVEALHDLQKSIELNDNRAIYRSRLLLDEDLAARSASLARIYNDLGFQQLALVEGWKSVNGDPSNYSAHRFLADLYSALPRHEIARVSELLQSQLLQPINLTPLQPKLAESSLQILDNAGPVEPSFNEFNSLFVRNRFALQASGSIGSQDTFGDEVVQSGLWGGFSYSLGQFHFETDGFRENNDLKTDIYNVFFQSSPLPNISIQTEYRHRETKHGDLQLKGDIGIFDPSFRRNLRTDSIRIGAHYQPVPHMDFIASVIFQDIKEEQSFFAETDFDSHGYIVELQHLTRISRYNFVFGGSFFQTYGDLKISSSAFNVERNTDLRHHNAYIYAHIRFPGTLMWTLGISFDFLDGEALGDISRVNPKFGLIWNITPNTTLRLAAFRTLKRSLLTDQTIEPTQVSGFNQFFDDPNGTKTSRYGIGLDQTISRYLYGGLEISRRELEVPIDLGMSFDDWNETLYRSYLNWTPHRTIAVSLDYQFEEFTADGSVLRPPNTDTHLLSAKLRYFHRFGLFGELGTIYVNQDVDFAESPDDDDQFVLIDAAIGYRLPKRRGIITLGVQNLFDEGFNFQGLNNRRSQQEEGSKFTPDRTITARITVSF